MDQIYDVAVIGAGPSGIAAAVYAAKYGAKTVLLEKDSIIGGTAFKACVHTLNGQSLSSMDGLLDGITKKAWGRIIFQPEDLLDKYYSLLSKYPITLLCGCEAISAEAKDGKITSLLCLSSAGKAAISAKIIIDASGSLKMEGLTGTSDLLLPAYCYMTGLIGKIETVGGKCYSIEAKKLLEDTVANSKETGKLSTSLFIQIQPTVRADLALITIKYENTANTSGALMRNQLNEAVKFMQSFGYGFENASLISSSKDIFYSASGSFNAKYTLALEEISHNKYFNDQIAALPDDDDDDERVYYIPYGSLLSARFDNLLLCGRNIGATTNAIMQIDAITTHFETGKAAGIAAAIAVKNEILLENVSPYEIVSKSQESISDKIEILNETMGIEKDEYAPSVKFNIIAESENERETPEQNFALKEKVESESFAELDKALGFIGEEILTAPEQVEDVQSFFYDIDSVMDIDSQSIVKKAAPEATTVEDIIEKMAGFTNTIQKDSSENEIFEPLAENIIDLTEEYMEENQATKAEGLDSQENEAAIQSALQNQLIDEIQNALQDERQDEFAYSPANEPQPEVLDSEENRNDEAEVIDAKEDEISIDKYFAAPMNLPQESTEIQEREDVGAIQAALQNQLIDEIESLQDEITDASLNEPMDDLSVGSKDLHDAEKLSDEISDIHKEVISNEDVLSLLYDRPDEPYRSNVESSNKPVKNIAQDEISLLYETKVDKKEPPQKKYEKKDKVSTILDMIYDITDSKEENMIIPDDLNKKDANSPAAQDKKTSKKTINTENFKAIKDFLYDDDE